MLRQARPRCYPECVVFGIERTFYDSSAYSSKPGTLSAEKYHDKAHFDGDFG